MVSVSLLCGVWNGGGVCCCQSCPVVQPCPAHPSTVLIGTAVVSCYCSLPVRGVWVVCVCLWGCVWWVSLCLSSPGIGMGWGYRGWWGGVVDGGWHGDGRAAVLLTSPSACWCPPFRLCGGRVEWRVGVVCVTPRPRVGSSPSCCPASLMLSRFPCVVPVPLLLRGVVFVACGEVRWGVLLARWCVSWWRVL